jgi:hypothetical protein
MKKEEFIALGISDDIAEKAATASAEELKGYVPKSRFDEVNEAKKVAESTIKERDKQLDDLKKSSGDNEELKKQIADLQEANKTAAQEYEKSMKQLKRDSIDTQILTEAGAKNTKAALALFDPLDDKLDEDAYKAERMKQLEAVKKDNGYLFAESKPTTPQVQGASPIPGSDDIPDTKRSGFESRLAEARKNNDNISAITIKREAAEAGIFLM